MTKSLEKAFAKNKSKKQGLSASEKTPLKKSLLFTLVGAGIGVVLSLLISSLLYKTLVLDVAQKQLDELAEQKAAVFAEHIEFQLRKLNSQVNFFTEKPGFIRALKTGDTAQLESYIKQMKQQFNGVEGVSVFKLGDAKLDETYPPIRYSELDLIQRAERGELLRPEAAKIENKWLISLVSRIVDDKEVVVGSIIIRFQPTVFVDGLNELLGNGGQLKIEQRYDNEKIKNEFITLGNTNKTLTKEAFVSGSYWYVSYRPSNALIKGINTNTSFPFALMGLLTLLLIGLSISIGYRVGNRIDNRLVSNVIDPVTGEVSATQEFNVPPVTDILDIDIVQDDEDLLGLGEKDVVESEAKVVEAETTTENEINAEEIPDVIFRAYDIRGLAKTQVTTKIAQYIGQALGSEAIDQNQDTLIVARDARLSSPELTEWLIRGIISTGCNVLNIGTVPTPLMYFATETLQESQSGVMVTASHNPGEYNGFKIVMDGKCRSGEDIKAVRNRILKSDFYQGAGVEHHHDVIGDYIDTIFSDVALAGDISIVIDAANGVTGAVAPRLFEELGCQVTTIFCDLDGKFPNHPPDPSIESNLVSLIEKVKEEDADLGVAFDGDGDRLAVVTPEGKIIWPDKLLMLFAKDIVSRNPGADVVFDVKCSRHLSTCVTSFGGRPIMWKTGHAPMKNKMVETGALVGGEYSGHIFIKDRWFGFDDGMYAAARLIEILSLQGESLDMIFDEFPESPSTPEVRISVDEERKFSIIEALKEHGRFEDAKLTLIDGVRADFPFGWGLIRASNTSAHLTLRFEADDEGSLHHIKSLFVKELRAIDNSIHVSWES